VTRSRRSPRPLTFAIEQLRDELAPETVLANAQLAWRDVVGEVIAAQAQPTSERGGVLTVSCSASVWAQELDLMAPDILERLNGRLGGTRLNRLRCVSTPIPDRP
jgi:predicted nucleic acid-binding Zn ribbon protein